MSSPTPAAVAPPALSFESTAAPRTVSERLSLRGHVLELDGFRALAVWMVLINHLEGGWRLPAEATSWMPRLVWQVVSHGWMGVDLFFVLSGFLITGILIDSKDDPHFFRNFYGRRALRIMPLYFSVILVGYLTYGGAYFLLSLLFMANFAPAFGVRTPHGPGVFWSLAIEEHFYLAWPLAARYLSRNALLATAIGIIIASPMLRWWGVGMGYSFDATYQYSFYRFDGLALGACLAMWVRSRFFTRRGAWMLVGLLVTVVTAATIALLPYGVFGTATQAAVALRSTQAQFAFASAVALALAYRNTMATAPLRTSFALYSAKLSYCIYLVHLMLGDLYYWALQRMGVHQIQAFGPVGALAVRSVVIIAASFAVAALSQKYLEAPFMRLRKHFV